MIQQGTIMVLKEKSQRFEPGLYFCIFVKNYQMAGSLFATNRFNVLKDQV